jgi:hypothetical protein
MGEGTMGILSGVFAATTGQSRPSG